jgi:Caspase domain
MEAAMSRRVCIAIGVSDAAPLDALPGAILAAEEVGQWARQSGFDAVKVVTDAGSSVSTAKPVTFKRIRKALEDLLPDGEETAHFVLYFAGHGVSMNASENLWLLTDFASTGRAVSVERLKNHLACFGIRNLTIFADACSSLPDTLNTRQLIADSPIVWEKSIRPDTREMKLDRFNAAHEGDAAYMIPATTETEARCIFSGALLEALWGHSEQAFDKFVAGKITAPSLAEFLDKRVEQISKEQRLNCDPDNHPTYPIDRVFFYDKAAPPKQPIPPFKPWPQKAVPYVTDAVLPAPQEPQRTPGGTSLGGLFGGLGAGTGTRQQGQTKNFQSEAGFDFSAFKKMTDGDDDLRELLGPDFGASHPRINTGIPLPDLSVSAVGALERMIRSRSRKSDEGLREHQRQRHDWREKAALQQIEAEVAKKQTRQEAKRIRSALVPRKVPNPEITNLIVSGGPVKQIWLPANTSIKQLDARAGRSTIQMGRDDAVQAMVEFDDGLFAPVVLYDRLVTILARDDRGVLGWTCASPQPWERANLVVVADMIAQMETGNLSAQQSDAMATDMRMMKHVNPVLGAICAYLYDYTGDLDNIRRMAYYYARNKQPIPFDIALMGKLKMWDGTDGEISAYVPAVLRRAPDTHSGRQPFWTTSATEAVNGKVAGRCPWLRQGWTFVDDANYDSVPVPMLAKPHKYLRPQSFTSLDRAGGLKLAKLWKLVAAA